MIVLGFATRQSVLCLRYHHSFSEALLKKLLLMASVQILALVTSFALFVCLIPFRFIFSHHLFHCVCLQSFSLVL